MRTLLAALILFFSIHASALTYEELVETIRTNEITSIEALLPKLPADFISDYALVHTTHSRQAASAERPRVILFGRDARLTCAYNGGEAGVAGNDTLECFQFRAPERRFDFREIRFPTAANGLASVRFSESGRSADGKIACAACHGADNRPNWDEYPRWPGVYNEDDGGGPKGEEEKYERFREKVQKHPRYQVLKLTRFRDYRTAHHNIRFADYLGRMNARRLNRLAGNKLAEWEVLALAVSGLGCPFDQQTRIEAATDIDPYRIFDKMGYSIRDWTLRRDGQPQRLQSRLRFEHQTGYGLQMVSFAMGEIGRLAESGVEPLKSTFAYVMANRKSYREKEQHADYERLDAILPGVDFYDDNFGWARNRLCDALLPAFQERYAKR